jgi:hypothetical protein
MSVSVIAISLVCACGLIDFHWNTVAFGWAAKEEVCPTKELLTSFHHPISWEYSSQMDRDSTTLISSASLSNTQGGTVVLGDRFFADISPNELKKFFSEGHALGNGRLHDDKYYDLGSINLQLRRS